MRVLLIGSGGREHSLAIKIWESKHVKKLYAIPGNPGIEQIAECHNVDIMDNYAIVQFAKQKKIDLVVVGPEAPLVNGLIDELEKEGIKAFGPNKKSARFEASKSFSREFMKKYNLPTVDFEEFTNFKKAKDYIVRRAAPIVVKADGLAKGKGVLVAKTVKSAIEFAKECLNGKFGEPKIIIEDYVSGEEVSLLAFLDSKTFKPMAYSQDHKTILEKDSGLNTGGMGAYSPATILQGFDKQIKNNILDPFLMGIKKEKIVYKGVLYIGLMKSSKGLKILEFNCRFGDPETQVIMPRLKTDIIDVMVATIDGKLKELELVWSKKHCVSVVISSKGYPEKYETGKKITGLLSVKNVIHAGTIKKGKQIYTNGGRVLNVVALGHSLNMAVEKAYRGVAQIKFEGSYFRRDIAKKELNRQKIFLKKM